MARLFALADLHLSQIGRKPMDIFGELWRDHAARMAAAWDRTVGSEDTILLGGDLSWGRDLDEAAPDLAWIAERPGHKILLRGNHDGWWRSAGKVRAALPGDCELLQANAVRVGPWVVIGSRGWLSPNDPRAADGDEAVYRRELGRLRQSIEFADRELDRALPRLALVHYPPRVAGESATEVTEQLVGAGVSAVVYGHLHGADHAIALRGEHDRLLYYFVAADAVEFTPVEIAPPTSDRSPRR
jgi:predicted phosphohydrolase